MSISDKAGAGCLLLFSLPFALVGAGMAIWLGLTVYDWSRARGWEEVPVMIERLQLEQKESDDGETFRINARYTYTYQGQSYTATRVALSNGADNIGNFWQDHYNELRPYWRQKRPYPGFVNPKRPSEAILIRKLRPEMVLFKMAFLLVFGGFGFGFVGFLILGIKRLGKEERLKKAYPKAPWRWRPEWEANQIPANERRQIWGLLAITLFWNALSFPAFILFFSQLTQEKEWLPLALLSLFPLIGTGMIWMAVRSIARYLKYGGSTLVLAQSPVPLGGALNGVISVPAKVHHEDGFTLTLSCIERTTTGSGKHRHTHEEVKWESENRGAAEAPESGLSFTLIPAQFQIPYTLPETSEKENNREILWRLKAEAATPGIDFSATYEVPVFITEESSPEAGDAGPPLPINLDSAETALMKQGIQITPLSGERIQIFFPPFRHKAIGLIFAICAACSMAGLIFCHLQGAGLFPVLITALLTVAFFCCAIFLSLIASRIIAAPHFIRFQGGLLARGKETLIPVEEIAGLEASTSLTYNNKPLWDITLSRKSGKNIKLARLLANRRDADFLIAYLLDHLDLPETP